MNREHGPSLLVLAALQLAACGQVKDPEPAPVAVRVQTVEARAVEHDRRRYSAQIMAESKVDLSFRVGGYIEELAKTKDAQGKLRAVQDGDPVKKGDVLARVRVSDYLQQLKEAKATLSEAQAGKEQARLDFERVRGLFENQGASKADLDGARARADAAKARAEAITARVMSAQQAVEDCSVKSPMDGILMKRIVEVGTLVGPGALGFVVADTQKVKAVFGVPDTLVETLKLGSTQKITTEATRGVEFEGHITRISPSADPKTRTFEVETTIDNRRQELKTGMVASLELSADLPVPEPTTLLPLSAIVRSPKNRDNFAVYLVEESSGRARARIREVELGEFLGNSIPVKSGLTPNERVIVMGATIVSDGEPVVLVR